MQLLVVRWHVQHAHTTHRQHQRHATDKFATETTAKKMLLLAQILAASLLAASAATSSSGSPEDVDGRGDLRPVYATSPPPEDPWHRGTAPMALLPEMLGTQRTRGASPRRHAARPHPSDAIFRPDSDGSVKARNLGQAGTAAAARKPPRKKQEVEVEERRMNLCQLIEEIRVTLRGLATLGEALRAVKTSLTEDDSVTNDERDDRCAFCLEKMPLSCSPTCMCEGSCVDVGDRFGKDSASGSDAEPDRDVVTLLPCQHRFHESCDLDNYMRNEVWRQVVPDRDLNGNTRAELLGQGEPRAETEPRSMPAGWERMSWLWQRGRATLNTGERETDTEAAAPSTSTAAAAEVRELAASADREATPDEFWWFFEHSPRQSDHVAVDIQVGAGASASNGSSTASPGRHSGAASPVVARTSPQRSAVPLSGARRATATGDVPTSTAGAATAGYESPSRTTDPVATLRNRVRQLIHDYHIWEDEQQSRHDGRSPGDNALDAREYLDEREAERSLPTVVDRIISLAARMMVATAGSDGPPPSKCPVCRQDVLSRVRVGSKHVRRLLKEIFVLEDEEGADDVPEEGVWRAKKSDLRKKFGIDTDFIAKKFESLTNDLQLAVKTLEEELERRRLRERHLVNHYYPETAEEDGDGLDLSPAHLDSLPLRMRMRFRQGVEVRDLEAGWPASRRPQESLEFRGASRYRDVAARGSQGLVIPRRAPRTRTGGGRGADINPNQPREQERQERAVVSSTQVQQASSLLRARAGRERQDRAGLSSAHVQQAPSLRRARRRQERQDRRRRERQEDRAVASSAQVVDRASLLLRARRRRFLSLGFAAVAHTWVASCCTSASRIFVAVLSFAIYAAYLLCMCEWGDSEHELAAAGVRLITAGASRAATAAQERQQAPALPVEDPASVVLGLFSSQDIMTAPPIFPLNDRDSVDTSGLSNLDMLLNVNAAGIPMQAGSGSRRASTSRTATGAAAPSAVTAATTSSSSSTAGTRSRAGRPVSTFSPGRDEHNAVSDIKATCEFLDRQRQKNFMEALWKSRAGAGARASVSGTRSGTCGGAASAAIGGSGRMEHEHITELVDEVVPRMVSDIRQLISDIRAHLAAEGRNNAAYKMQEKEQEDP